MIHTFDHQRGLVVVYATVQGPTGQIIFKLALDTGATDTMLRPAKLVSVGYDLSLSPHVEVTTGGGITQVPDIKIQRIATLGQERADFPILAHTLPPSATVDGVLGLDFMRGQKLTVDFRSGRLTLD